MPKLLYLSLMRFPTEKAHGLQIVQNCEAFAQVGYDVELWVTQRQNTPEMGQITDPFAYYGVRPSFQIRRVPVLDFMPYTQGFAERVAFYGVQVTFLLSLIVMLWRNSADVYYTRDESVAWLLTWLKPKKRVAYEAHLYASGGRGAWLQTQVCRRVGSVIAITPRLAEDLMTHRGATVAKTLVAHDGIRAERFANVPTQAQAREQIGWQPHWFVVGFIGRLQMLNMDKGIGTLIRAIAMSQSNRIYLGIVGGPDALAEQYREQWLALGLPPEGFLYMGHVSPERVPLYLSAFDVCAMPHPNTVQYANYTSPLKLFEYMASGRAIVASDLAGWRDVVQNEHNALLVTAENTEEWAQAIQRLYQDAPLRQTLGTNAQHEVFAHYTWQARASKIQAHINVILMNLA